MLERQLGDRERDRQKNKEIVRERMILTTRESKKDRKKKKYVSTPSLILTL